MTKEIKQIIKDLRSYARKYKDGSTLGRAIIGTEDVMFAATDAIVALSKERDSWKLRAEAAEKDLYTRRCCFTCSHYYEDHKMCENCFDDKASRADGTWMAKWEWRGPCAENGGVDKE